MIKLFNIPCPARYNFSSIIAPLDGPPVWNFEERFADYVGAKYACSCNSASSAIFLLLYNENTTVEIPSMIPPVVCNSIINSGNTIKFVDDVSWVGGSYILHDFGDYKLIDSAHRVDRNQFREEAEDNDLMVFSFYPTKPVGGIDGGMVVSNNKDAIEAFRITTMNGMSSGASWNSRIKCVGWKMYMNSYQAIIAHRNLEDLITKKEKLAVLRQAYNEELGYSNTSDHLYRINVDHNESFVNRAKTNGIECGIHYHAMHTNPFYASKPYLKLPSSTKESHTTVSIPFHEYITLEEFYNVCKYVKKNSRVRRNNMSHRV